MNLADLSREERSLLLYLETCAVDSAGAVNARRMSQQDMDLANIWRDSGFIKFGRIASMCLPMPSGSTHWCELSEEAWRLAHEARMERANRMKDNRRWITGEEAGIRS